MKVEELEAEALQLDVRERARLAAKLLSSLDTLSDAENERLWAEEAERRDRELDEGRSTGRPAQEVIADAMARFS